MENKAEIKQIIENLYEELNEIEVIIKILKNEVQSADYELYELKKAIKKEAESSTN